MNRTYKNTTIAILLACILTMAIGYSILSQRLNISGTTSINSDFNIQVVGIREVGTVGLAETANIDFTPTSATYSTNIQAPGDEAIYEIVIENKGSMPGYVIINGEEDEIGDYNLYDDGKVELGIVYILRVPIEEVDIDTYPLTGGINYLNPGEKLYVYGGVYFNTSSTAMPETKEFSNTVKFDFFSIDKVPGEEIVVNTPLLDTIYDRFPITTSGDGLYEVASRRYAFKSDGTAPVNNYVKIDGKMWRLLGFYDSQYDTDYYYIIEDDDTVNEKQIFSNIANSSGFYNDVDSSSLIDYIANTIDTVFIKDDNSNGYNENTNYVLDTELFEGDANTRHLISVQDILVASSNSNCSINNLSTGGCRSWLTENGDTYLINPIYESNKTTNTGNIAYLQDNKVISVDPRNTNYGEYKRYGYLFAECGYKVLFTNPDADGSKSNPYIINVDDMYDMPVC